MKRQPYLRDAGNARPVMWCIALMLATLISLPKAFSAPPPMLTPEQLVALGEAAQQRYWSLSYSITARDYRPAFAGGPIERTPQSILRQNWLWTPWRCFCHEHRETHWPGVPIQTTTIFRSFDGTTARYLQVQHPAQSGQKRLLLGAVGRNDPILMHTSLVSTIFANWIWAGVNNRNSKVTWDRNAHEYVLKQTISRSGSTLSYITWINPSRGFVVTRDEMSTGGKIFHEDRYRQWREVRKGFWLPFSMTNAVPGMFTIRSTVRRVRLVNRAIPTPLFELKFPAGTLVNDGIRLGPPHVVRARKPRGGSARNPG